MNTKIGLFPITKNKYEKGQSLVIIAIMFLGLVAVAALVIDGGVLYVNRRNVQTAADAAALAGAYEKCVNNGGPTAVQNVVNEYAVTENGATAVESATIDAHGYVVVQTRLETSSFLAGLLGFENNMARATASAGCFPPGTTKNILPIAWSCQPPVGGSVENCVIHSIPWTLFNEEIYPHYENGLSENGTLILDEGNGVSYSTYADGSPANGKLPYLVMDDSTFNTAQCKPPIGSGLLVCDFNNDGILDLTGGGDRGWLSLNGSMGGSDLKDIIVNGYPNPVTLPQWFPGPTGSKSSVFGAAKGDNHHPGIEGKLVLVPVFNAYRIDATVGEVTASSDFLPGDLITSGSGHRDYYRVAGFAPFFVTCVSSKPSEKCPAKSYAYASLPENQSNNIASIEGYFVDGYIAGTGIDPDGFDLGVYMISLTQ